MRKTNFKVLILLLVICDKALADIELPTILGKGAILQREKPVTLWGKSDKSEEITVSLDNKIIATTLANDGNWQYKLKAQPAGGPHCLKFEASNTVEICDIYFGDLWLASGQSNMDLTVSRIKYYFPKEFSKINYPEIRQFSVPKHQSFDGPKSELSGGSWIPAQSLYIDEFSAVAYFFAKNIHLNENVPVGIVKNAMGGSRAQSWIGLEQLRNFPNYYKEAQQLSDNDYLEDLKQQDNKRIRKWLEELEKADEGLNKKLSLLGKKHYKWYQPELDDVKWQKIEVPGLWENNKLSSFTGVIWLRKTINLPKSVSNQASVLRLGTLVDADIAYINGKKVGETNYKYPPRRYFLEPGMLKEGDNTIAIRLQVNSGEGGFVSDKPYWLQIGKDRLTLIGEWKYKIGVTSKPMPESNFVEYLAPTGYYNSMLAPLKNLQFSGVLWYQGESNVSYPSDYENLMGVLVGHWRELFKQPSLPFLLVQLANYSKPSKSPQESQWAELRQKQLNTLKIPNTALAVTIDVGEWNDIHPVDKRTVGNRLALAAQKLVYGKNVVHSGPIFRCYEKNEDENAITLYFDEVGSGLAAGEEGLVKRLAIKTRNQNYQWKFGQIIDKDKMIVRNVDSRGPISIRYAWSDNPIEANLYNLEALPASPFESSTLCR